MSLNQEQTDQLRRANDLKEKEIAALNAIAATQHAIAEKILAPSWWEELWWGRGGRLLYYSRHYR